jgi:hypothetical protein
LTLFSQKTVFIDGDTSICFSIPKSKFLLKQVYTVTEKDTLLKITETQLQVCIQGKLIYEQQVQAYQQIINTQLLINKNISAVLSQKDENIKTLNTQLSKQKAKTWISILGGVVTTVFISYLYIQK